MQVAPSGPIYQRLLKQGLSQFDHCPHQGHCQDSFQPGDGSVMKKFVARLMTTSSSEVATSEARAAWTELGSRSALGLAGQLGGLAAGASCYHCYGTGKCQADWPKAGSGVSTSGQPCGKCSGSGNCWFCGGTGKDQSGAWPTQTAA